MHIAECKQGDDLWPTVAELFPRNVAWMNDPTDDGDYHFFAATDDHGVFLGATVIDIGPMGLGPLCDMTTGFLENIEVLQEYRRKGVGAVLLRAALDFAWERGARSVRWTVDYENLGGMTLYKRLGLAFVPEEDPNAEEPQRCYTVVAINPSVARVGYASQPARGTDGASPRR